MGVALAGAISLPVPRRPRPRPVRMSRSSPAGILGSIFGSIGHAVLGAFSWTIGLASKFILTTIGALVRMLIPRSWANEGVEIMEWIVAVPNYAGTVTSPDRPHRSYGFAGINALRDLFTWIGVGLLPLTLAVRHDASDARRARPCRRADRSRVGDRCGAGLLSVLVDGGGGDDRHGHALGPDPAAPSSPDCTS